MYILDACYYLWYFIRWNSQTGIKGKLKSSGHFSSINQSKQVRTKMMAKCEHRGTNQIPEAEGEPTKQTHTKQEVLVFFSSDIDSLGKLITYQWQGAEGGRGILIKGRWVFQPLLINEWIDLQIH